MPEQQFPSNAAPVFFLNRCFYDWKSFFSASKCDMGVTYPDALENTLVTAQSSVMCCLPAVCVGLELTLLYTYF